jgi:beta-mannosidase
MTISKDVNSAARLDLCGSWQFCQADLHNWLPATVPGCNFTDLLANQLITDPFYRDNESALQWIETKDWAYKREFELNEGQLSYWDVQLVAEGLDTYCEIFINGHHLASTNNMFVGKRLSCKDYLQVGRNSIAIHFRSPITEAYPKCLQNGFLYPAENDKSEHKLSVYSRKAPCHFGWDWGPKFVTSGIWRNIYLDFVSGGQISDLHFQQHSLNTEIADFSLHVKVAGKAGFKGQLHLYCEQAPQLNCSQTFSLESGLLEEAFSDLCFDFALSDPQLWWPNGLGEAFLYHFRVELRDDTTLLASAELEVGLRTIEVVSEADAMGQAFYLKVNGHPIFMKGANYIPDDSFVHRVTSERHSALFTSVSDANMNMLRVWGGGIYQDDTFYQLADRHGILIWQDFMFACSLYPADDVFLANVREEAIYNVKRLRNHPCIALWCGNNEVEMAIEKWQWPEKFGYSDELYANLKQDYLKLFDRCLPEVVSELDPGRFYLPSSPIGYWENDEDNTGNHHYWGVWHGEEPFSEYQRRIPRFMSEFGFQSLPMPSSMARYTQESDLQLDSTVMQVHQKHPRGNKLIRSYLDQEFNAPKDFSSLLYLSQVQQALGLKLAFEAHRGAMPFCMGSLYWQLNDTWPGASWSGIDYYGRWKALHYQVKRSFCQQLVVIDSANDRLSVKVVSDALVSMPVTLQLNLRDFAGHSLWSHSLALTLPANAQQRVFELPLSAIMTHEQTAQRVLCAELLSHSGKQVLYQTQHFFLPNKQLALEKPVINIAFAVQDENLSLRLTCQTLARQVYVEFAGIETNFSDNFFDLLPNQAKHVSINLVNLPKADMQELSRQLRIVTLFDSYSTQPTEIITINETCK